MCRSHRPHLLARQQRLAAAVTLLTLSGLVALLALLAWQVTLAIDPPRPLYAGKPVLVLAGTMKCVADIALGAVLLSPGTMAAGWAQGYVGALKGAASRIAVRLGLLAVGDRLRGGDLDDLSPFQRLLHVVAGLGFDADHSDRPLPGRRSGNIAPDPEPRPACRRCFKTLPA